eukprot:g14170.t1
MLNKSLSKGVPKGPRPTTKPTAWMNPTVRAWLVALRPWSFPASLVPVVLAGAILYRNGTVETLYTGAFSLCFLIVLSLHAAANLTNTYYDYKHGVDQKSTADDRALVDNTVTPETVFRSAMCCFASGLGSGLGLTYYANYNTIYVVAIGAMLGFFYTADPLSLKGLGLGDVIIFLCFGPLLMSGVSMACCGHLGDKDVIYYSIPIGLLTVDILHINNERDVDEDRKAGLRTTAMLLGTQLSYCMHCSLLAVSYAMVLWRGFVDKNYMLFIVILTAPWSMYVTRRFAAKLFHELPQRIAQHNLMFGTLLICALSERMFFVRVMLACLYYLGGVNNIIMWTYNIELVHMKTTNIFPFVPRWFSRMLFLFAIALQLVPSVIFILGYETKLMAAILLVFIVPITFIVHDMWTIEHDNPAHDPSVLEGNKSEVASRRVPIFPTEFDNEFVHFFKNVGMIGGMMLFVTLEGNHLTEGDLLPDGFWFEVLHKFM